MLANNQPAASKYLLLVITVGSSHLCEKDPGGGRENYPIKFQHV